VAAYAAVIQAVLWDNDGVLVDTECLFFEVTRAAFASVGALLRPDHWAAAYLGRGLRSSDLAADLGIEALAAANMLETRNAHYRNRLRGDIPVRPGVRETLEALHGRVRLGMVTGSPRDQLELMHHATGLLDFFELVVTGDDCVRAKPDPEAYLSALNRLGLPAEACLAVEDSPRGWRSAQAAGIRCVLMPHELTDLSACDGAPRIGNDARELLPYVRLPECS
jgi:HAD superfamily hydrolase (TIGR01509 family)